MVQVSDNPTADELIAAELRLTAAERELEAVRLRPHTTEEIIDAGLAAFHAREAFHQLWDAWRAGYEPNGVGRSRSHAA